MRIVLTSPNQAVVVNEENQPIIMVETPKQDGKSDNDAEVFGADQWVYCRQHVKPHTTGWCGVSVGDKIGLGIVGNDTAAAKAAYEKCRDWGFPIHGKEK